MKKSNLRATAAWQALALLGAGVPVAFMGATPAAAQQDYTRGSVGGTVVNEAGSPLVGAVVTITSNEQGFTQNTRTGANGRFDFNLLPGGSYTITIQGPGGEVVNDPGVSVVAGRSTNFVYTAVPVTTVEGTGVPSETVGGGQLGDPIIVTGRRVQTNDLGSTTTGLSIDVATVVENIPVQKTQSGLILLAPGTSQGDAGFADCTDCVSFGGATIAENSYYVNGLNTTNFRTMVGNSLVPFEFYRTFDVRTGGWTAEFGRALGGVTSAVTKSGSNNFEAGAVMVYSPDFLQEDSPNTFFDPEGEDLKQRNDSDFTELITANFYASGALIRDRLFAYGLFSPRYNRTGDSSVQGGFRFEGKSSTPFYGLKLDAIPLDGHRFEGTFWSDKRSNFFDYIPIDSDGERTSQSIGRTEEIIGGRNYIAQYTGRLTDFLTLSGLFGINNYARKDNILGETITPIIQTQLGGPIRTAGSVSGIPLVELAGEDKRTVYRVDADVYANFFGRHHFRFGWDREDLDSIEDTRYPTERIYLFRPTYIRTRTYINTGGFTSKQTAFYLQDSWDLFNERVNLNLGVRNDNYENQGITGDTFIKMKNQWAPRLGASFDVFGDKLTKVQAFYGRYFLGVPTNTNIRLGGAETFYEQRFGYAPGVTGGVFDPDTGVPVGQQFDATGAPILGPLTAANVGPCPTFGPGAGQLCYGVFSDGLAGPTDSLVTEDLKPMYQDEMILGATHRMSDWTFGARYINRRLKSTLEDVSIDHAVQQYCVQEGIANCQYYWYGFHQYVLSNPGEPITVRLDGDTLCETDPRACEVVTLGTDLLGYVKPKRKYDAVEFLVNKAFNGRYGFDFSYTWAKVRGNYEGSVKSDNNQDDAGLTQDFDLPGFQEGAYGILANERKHTFKLFGSYKPMDWLTLGANATLQSPRNFSCIGVYPIPYSFPDTTGGPSLYGVATFWSSNPACADKAVETTTGPQGQPYYLVPRGTAFKGKWLKNIDFGAQFALPRALGNSSFRIDVFNIFNFESEVDFVEFSEEGNRDTRSDFGLVSGYQAPRRVQFTWALRFGGRPR